MGKMKELFIAQQLSGSIGGDEDYLYEQYLKEKEYRDESFDPNFMHEWIRKNGLRSTPEEEEQNFKQTKKQDGNIT